jgi:hypothetical protein
MDAYSTLMDQAEAAGEDDPALQGKIIRLRLAQEYTFLQQARFYGTDVHGLFDKDDSGAWQVKDGFINRIDKFVMNCKKAGVTALSEGGMTPEEYLAEWNDIISKGVRSNIALKSEVFLEYPAIPEYMEASPFVLTDGKPGYRDFSYNWLCFSDSPMIATVDLFAERNVNAVNIGFLHDPRHWYFPPESVEIYSSVDGREFTLIGQNSSVLLPENYTIEKKNFHFRNPQPAVKVRYIRVIARGQHELPDWRMHKTKKPMLACDEIWIE